MSAFLPLRVGGWAFGEILTSAQMNQLNTDFPFALNGRDGGTYSPTNVITIGGAGLDITGQFQAIGDASFSSDVTIGGNTTFNGNITFFAAITGGAVFSGGLVDMQAGAQVEGGLTVASGFSVSSGNATFAANLSVTSKATTGSLANTGNSKIGTLIGAILYSNDGVSDAGRVPMRPLLGTDIGTVGTKANVQPAIYERVIFPPGTLTTSRHWQLSDTSFPSISGDHIAFYNGDAGSNTITVYNPSGTALGVVSGGSTVRFVKIGSTWYFGGS